MLRTSVQLDENTAALWVWLTSSKSDDLRTVVKVE